LREKIRKKINKKRGGRIKLPSSWVKNVRNARHQRAANHHVKYNPSRSRCLGNGFEEKRTRGPHAIPLISHQWEGMPKAQTIRMQDEFVETLSAPQ